jgi:hypothetical protein
VLKRKKGEKRNRNKKGEGVFTYNLEKMSVRLNKRGGTILQNNEGSCLSTLFLQIGRKQQELLHVVEFCSMNIADNKKVEIINMLKEVSIENRNLEREIYPNKKNKKYNAVFDGYCLEVYNLLNNRAKEKYNLKEFNGYSFDIDGSIILQLICENEFNFKAKAKIFDTLKRYRENRRRLKGLRETCKYEIRNGEVGALLIKLNLSKNNDYVLRVGENVKHIK